MGVWTLGVFVLRRPEATGAQAAVMAGLDSVFDCVRCGFMKWARGSNPEVNRWEASRAGPETGAGTGGTNSGLDWTTCGWACGATRPAPLLRDWWCGLLLSLLVEVFCCLGTCPVGRNNRGNTEEY